VLIHLGDSLLATGNRQEALAAWREALAILEAIHGPDPDRVRSRISQQEHGVKTDTAGRATRDPSLEPED